MPKELFSAWEGVYQSFKEAQGSFEAFKTDKWLNQQKNKIKAKISNLKGESFISTEAVSRDYPLSVVAAILLGIQKEISILDFGGGMGESYLELLSKVPIAEKRTKYIIVEMESTLRSLPPELKDFPLLRFVQDYENVEDTVDILHFGSTLHYIEYWQELLSALIQQFQPTYIILSDLIAGKIPSFVSIQKYYGMRLPCHFFNIKEIQAYFNDKKYTKIYETFFVNGILQQEEVFPNFALPSSHQIRSAVNLIYKA